MTRIYDIRGTHGSGKSFIPWNLIFNGFGAEEVWETDPECHVGYTGEIDLADRWFVIGRYNEFGGGGCDGVSPPDEICRRVRVFAPNYDILILEGILVAHTFKRYSDLANEMIADGHEYHFLFLDTPLKTCIDRVRQRRKRKGNDPDFNTENLENDFRQIHQNLPQKFVNAGHSVRHLQHTRSLEDFLEILHADRTSI